MESEVIKYFLTQGAFAALFVWLLLDTRKDSKSREKDYQVVIRENQKVIGKLTSNLTMVKDIKEDVEEIKSCIFINREEKK